MASQFGNATVGSSTQYFSQVNTFNQNACFFSGWPGGTVSSISVFFAGHNQTTTAAMCIWDHNGTLLQTSGNFILPSGSGAFGGQSWQTVSTNWNIAADPTGIFIGFWRDAARSDEFITTASGTTYRVTNTSGSPGGMSFSNGVTGTMGAYITYTQGGIPTWSGSSFVKHPVMVWNGGSWVWRPVYTWNGSSWVRRGRRREHADQKHTYR